MNNNPYNTQVYNAAPSFLPANGLSMPVGFGILMATMGLPINGVFRSDNYIKTNVSQSDYIKNNVSQTNYIYIIKRVENVL